MAIDELIGTWHSYSGTFDMMMSSSFVFKDDHTGIIVTRSVLGGEQTIPFSWERIGNSKIRILRHWPNDDAENDAHENLNEEDPDDAWEYIQYGFKDITTDVGTRKCLVELVKGELSDTFLLPASPLYKQET